MADVQPGIQNAQDIAVPQRVPRILNRVLGKADVDAGAIQLRHPGDAAPFRPAVKPALQMNAFGRAGDKVDARGFSRRNSFEQ